MIHAPAKWSLTLPRQVSSYSCLVVGASLVVVAACSSPDRTFGPLEDGGSSATDGAAGATGAGGEGSGGGNSAGAGGSSNGDASPGTGGSEDAGAGGAAGASNADAGVADTGVSDAMASDAGPESGADAHTPELMDVSLGNDFACAVHPDGSLWCWGRNNFGKLGLGDTNECDGLGYCSEPVRVGMETDWATVAAGAAFSCALRSDGELWCWGRNNFGQLGLGNTTACEDSGHCVQPTRVGTSTDWLALDAGNGHICSTRSNGSLWCWGRNQWGQLGLGDVDCTPNCPSRFEPEQVGMAMNWTAFALGSWHTCGLRSDDSLWCWGENRPGQLGVGDSEPRTEPTQVTTPATGWATLGLGVGGALGIHTCSIDTDGALWCWGRNQEGQLGLGTTDADPHPEPERVGDDTDWVRVAVGYAHTCGIRSGGSLWCWGDNEHGQLGLGDEKRRPAPSPVAEDTEWADVFAAIDQTCALDTAGSLWCWGDNDYGQAGAGDTDPHLTPSPVSFSMP